MLLTNVLWSCIWLKILVLRFTMHFWFFSSTYWKIQSNIYHLFLVVSLTTGFQCNVPSCFNTQSPNKWRSRKYWVNVDSYKHRFCVKKCLHSYFNLQTAWFSSKEYFFYCSVALGSSSYLDPINVSSVLNRGFSGFKTSWWPLEFHWLLDCMLPAIL